MDEAEKTSLVADFTATIVSAYVSNNSVAANDLPNIIKAVHAEFNRVMAGETPQAPAEKLAPAVPLRKAVQPDFVVDLFTGKKFKSLKRHLRTVHNMTPEEYRAYWGLPKDSPMVAPNYAKARSDLAKSMGLGQGGRQPPKVAEKAPRPPRAKQSPKSSAEG